MDTTALAIFRYLLSLVSTTQNAKLDSGGGFMPVVIERIGADTYSIAHYGQQNGDLMADPEMTFRGDGTPLTYGSSCDRRLVVQLEVAVNSPLIFL